MEKSTTAVSSRNGRVEALRILAMVLILINHTMPFDWYPAASFPFSVLYRLISNLGGVGDVLFFGVTAFYLCQRSTSVKDSFRRSWLLWRQLAYYSVGLFLITLAVWCADIGFHVFDDWHDLLSLGLRSIMPFASRLWWYPAAYIVFLIALPFLNLMLKSIDGNLHGAIAGILFSVCAIPVVSEIAVLGYSPALFIFQYIVFSWVVWYLRPSKELLKTVALFAMIIGLVGPIIGGVLGSDDATYYLNRPQSLPSMCVGFSLVLLAAEKHETCSRVVKIFASCSLAAYLLLTHPAGVIVVSKLVSIIVSWGGDCWLQRIALETLLAISFFLFAVPIDCARQLLFRLIFKGKDGQLFDYLWGKVSTLFPEALVLEVKH